MFIVNFLNLTFHRVARLSEPCFFLLPSFPNTRNLLKSYSFVCFPPLFNNYLAFYITQPNAGTCQQDRGMVISFYIHFWKVACLQDWTVDLLVTHFPEEPLPNWIEATEMEEMRETARSHRAFSSLCGKPEGWQGFSASNCTKQLLTQTSEFLWKRKWTPLEYNF